MTRDRMTRICMAIIIAMAATFLVAVVGIIAAATLAGHPEPLIALGIIALIWSPFAGLLLADRPWHRDGADR